ncbi:hypothetical protein NI376_16555 [Pseudoalteromonas piscicida]|nr:hypothetical protein NI376_16555 [Pseudoalteromonas piscicida]
MALFDLLAQPSRQAYSDNNLSHLSDSVCKHLTQLLNARRGVLEHLGDYGLPDVEDLYKGYLIRSKHLPMK